uniref:Uncharacterized protein n=1 Tax=Lotharella globosa TaxID=91324 RepID=A0A6V3KQU5_9EUKA|mmetsp:Transcript_18648/g.37698  ORF Transcript_18648/g.37698 Transcript_18648/m.37698 type:complete len:420 (-) Transcript_18648:488-1747(-)|eukprot:CAMPEP_0167794208 /NCGR_PEP_ID=MMETSP0111_2-20121227/13672_1 /TAXON_ID=91324 /ORGANISM="Lotharella globosa, Strain CCCM811" /LENGTH=419 /DNA_ID=CAMNT_0007687579 /DNA_START=73 /DNA_END=1332 /DNA_ORIENTATION=-
MCKQANQVDSKLKTVTSGDQTEVLIKGRWYSIKDFARKHPGGRIVNFYRGKDASQAYREFHTRSTRADKWLKNMKSRPAKEGESVVDTDALTKDFVQLRKDLEAEGFFKPDYVHVCFRFAEIIAMHAIGLYLAFNGWLMTGIAILGVAEGRCGWLMHEGGHNSLTGHIPTDHFLQVLTYGLGCGMSAAWWRNQHNKHHAMPQKLEHDVDLNTLPLVLFNLDAAAHQKKAPKSKTWIRMQALLFPNLICSLVAAFWQLYLHPRHALRTKHYAELVCMAARWGFIFAYLPQFYGFWNVFACAVLANGIGATYIFCNFAVSHTHLPVVKADDDVSWVIYSAKHTMNVDSGAFGWVDWWMSYLNFQIEHHLFPSMPQFRHPIVSKRVKALFEKHGVPYLRMSYVDAMKTTFGNLDQVGHAFYG